MIGKYRIFRFKNKHMRLAPLIKLSDNSLNELFIRFEKHALKR